MLLEVGRITIQNWIGILIKKMENWNNKIIVKHKWRIWEQILIRSLFLSNTSTLRLIIVELWKLTSWFTSLNSECLNISYNHSDRDYGKWIAEKPTVSEPVFDYHFSVFSLAWRGNWGKFPQKSEIHPICRSIIPFQIPIGKEKNYLYCGEG